MQKLVSTAKLLSGNHIPTQLPSRTANSSTPIRATHHTYTIHVPARCIRDGGEIIHDSDLSKLIPAPALPRRANQLHKVFIKCCGLVTVHLAERWLGPQH